MLKVWNFYFQGKRAELFSGRECSGFVFSFLRILFFIQRVDSFYEINPFQSKAPAQRLRNRHTQWVCVPGTTLSQEEIDRKGHSTGLSRENSHGRQGSWEHLPPSFQFSPATRSDWISLIPLLMCWGPWNSISWLLLFHREGNFSLGVVTKCKCHRLLPVEPCSSYCCWWSQLHHGDIRDATGDSSPCSQATLYCW